MPGREGSRCLTRQEQVASYSRALVMTAATATILRAAVLLRRIIIIDNLIDNLYLLLDLIVLVIN